MLFRTRNLLVRQRTQTINTLHGHLAELKIVAPQGPVHVTRLAKALEYPGLPDRVRTLGTLLFDRIVALDAEIAELAKEVGEAARLDDDAATSTRSALTASGASLSCGRIQDRPTLRSRMIIDETGHDTVVESRSPWRGARRTLSRAAWHERVCACEKPGCASDANRSAGEGQDRARRRDRDAPPDVLWHRRRVLDEPAARI